MLALQAEAAPDHHRLDGVVEQRRDQRVLDTRHEQRLVDEAVLRAAHAAQGLALQILLLLGQLIDDQHLEIGALALDRALVLLALFLFLLALGLGHLRAAPIAVAQHLADDSGDRLGEFGVLVFTEEVAEPMEQAVAGIGPVELDRTQHLQQTLGLGLKRLPLFRLLGASQLLGDAAQAGPAIAAQLLCAVIFGERLAALLAFLHGVQPPSVFLALSV